MRTLLDTCHLSVPTHVTSAPAVMLTLTAFKPASVKMSPTALPTPVSSMHNCAGFTASYPHNGGRDNKFFTSWTTLGYGTPNGNRSKCLQLMRSADTCLRSSTPQCGCIC